MGEYEFFEEDWEGISPEAKDLISKLLVVDPSKRLKASAALKHPWLCEVDGDTLSNRDLSISLNSLKSSRGIMSLTNERGAKAEWMAEPREAIE